MGYRCRFLDNESYTAADVNDAICAIAGEGAAFCDTGDTLSDFNAALENIVGAGTQLAGCKVTKTGDIYKIGEGVCFAKDGVQVEFDDEGYEFAPEDGVYTYVYVHRDAAKNVAEPVVSDTAGTENDVPLAEISESGEIIDTRRFAAAKVMLKSGQQTPSKEFHIEKTLTYNGDCSEYALDTGFTEWKYLLVKNIYLSTGFHQSDVNCSCPAIDMSDGEIHYVPDKNTNTSRYAAVRKEGSILRFMAQQNGYANMNLDFKII